MAYKKQNKLSESPVKMECEMDLGAEAQSSFGSAPKPGTKRYQRWAFRQSRKRRKSCNTKRHRSMLFGL